MTQTVSRGGSTPVVTPPSKNKVLIKIGSRKPKPQELSPPEQPGKAEYGVALVQAEKQRDEIVALKEMADPAEIKRLVDLAKTLANDPPQFIAAKRELDKVGPIHLAQKNAALLKEADKTEFNRLLPLAKAALLTVAAPADASPLTELILASEGLGERGQYAAAVAKIKPYPKLVLDLKDKGSKEPGGQVEYNKQVLLVRNAVTLLTTGELQEFGDPDPLQLLLDAATVHERAGRFASALESLNGHAKIAKTQLDAARKKKEEREEYESRQERCRELTLAVKVSVPGGSGKPPIIIDCSTELFVMRTAAARLAALGQYKDASSELANVETVGAAAVKEKNANVSAVSLYAAKLQNAKDKLALLHPPLANVEPLTKLIFDAERLVEKAQYAAAVKLLNGADKEYAKQQKLELKRGPEQTTYQEALRGAETLVTNLRKVPLADAAPLEQLVVLAKSLAEGGNFELAAKTLARAITISNEETEKARGQTAAKADFEREFKLAETALANLVKLGNLADPKALQGMVDLGRNLGAGGKYASGLAALKGWKAESDERAAEAERRRVAQGLYDGKLRETQTQAARLNVQRYKDIVAIGITDAEGQALSAHYDEAVATLDKQLEAIAGFLEAAEEQKGLRANYERDLKAAQLRVKGLDDRKREADANLIQAKGLVDKAAVAASEGRYEMANDYVRGINVCLDKAEIAADRDDEKASLYQAEQIKADREFAQLLGLGDKATSEPLGQLISLAASKAERGLFAEAYELIKTHTEKYNELVSLHGTEDGKAKDYNKQLPKTEQNLLTLQGTPHAEPAEMEALIAQAKQEAAAGKFASGCVTLAAAEIEFGKQNVLATAADNKEKQIAKAEPKFKQRRAAVEQLLADLLVTPGTEEAAAAIRRDLLTADTAAKQKDFRTGQKLLKKTIVAAKEAKTKSGKALDDVGEVSGLVSKDYGSIKKLSSGDEKKIIAAGKEYKVARAGAESALNTFRAVATTAQVQEFEKRIVTANTQVLSAKQQTTAVAGLKLLNGGIADLNKLALEIAAAQLPITGAKGECGTLNEELRAELQRLQLTARSEEVQPLQTRFDKLQFLLSANEFEAAQLKLEALKADVGKKTATVTKDMADWADVEKEIAETNRAIQIYVGDPILNTAAVALINQIANIKEVLIKKEKSYRQAVEEYGYVKDQLGHFEGSRQQVVEFGPKREEADREVKAEDLKIGTALTELKKAMKDADPTGKERSPAVLETERKTIMDAWALRSKKAADEAELNKAGALKALQTLAGKITEMAKDPAAANSSADKDTAAAEFETARTAADKAMEPVRSRGGNEAAALQKEFTDFVNSASGDYAAATLGMNGLKSRAEGLVATLDKQRLEAVVKARARAAAAVTEIDTLQKGLKQWFPTSSDLGKEFAAFFEDQKKQIAALEGLRESGNLKAIASADAQLDKLMSRTRAAAADARSETAGGSSFKTVLARRKAIEDKLKNAAFKKCAPTALAKLQKEFTDVSDKTKSQEPSEAMAALIKIDASVTPGLEAAERAQGLRLQIKTKAAEALTALKPIKAAAPQYYDKLFKQLKKAKKDGNQEKGEQPALTLLGTLKADIDKALVMARDKPSDLAGKEKGAKDEKAALENAKLTWESTLDVFDRTALPAASKAVSNHPEGDATQLDDLKNLRDKALEAAKAGDYLGATKQMQAATKVAERVQAAPQGIKTTSRDNLPRVEAGWKSAVQAIKVGIGKVKKDLSELAKTESIKELVAINRALDHLVGQAFDPNAFSDVVQVLGTKGNKPAERRASRELALRAVREYRATLKDPVMVVLFKANPFAKVPLNQVKAALDDLDLNIQRAV